jgi:hypothetical protein
MKRLTLLALVGLTLLLGLPASAQEVVPVSSLLTLPDTYDQQIVTIRGEIVGDYGDRGDVVWVQVNDDAYVDEPSYEVGRLSGTNTGISVKIDGSIPDDFGPPGAHGVRGPIVLVSGVFRDLDPELGGLTYLEATEVTLLEAARVVPEREPDITALVAGALLTLGGLLALAARRDLLRPRRSR